MTPRPKAASSPPGRPCPRLPCEPSPVSRGTDFAVVTGVAWIDLLGTGGQPGGQGRNEPGQLHGEARRAPGVPTPRPVPLICRRGAPPQVTQPGDRWACFPMLPSSQSFAASQSYAFVSYTANRVTLGTTICTSTGPALGRHRAHSHSLPCCF